MLFYIILGIQLNLSFIRWVYFCFTLARGKKRLLHNIKSIVNCFFFSRFFLFYIDWNLSQIFEHFNVKTLWKLGPNTSNIWTLDTKNHIKIELLSELRTAWPFFRRDIFGTSVIFNSRWNQQNIGFIFHSDQPMLMLPVRTSTSLIAWQDT